MQLRSDRRNMPEIFYSLLNAIREEKLRNGRVVLTRIQHRTNIAYSRMSRYLKEMQNFGFITEGNCLDITEKGHDYFIDYSKINDLISRTKKKYFRR